MEKNFNNFKGQIIEDSNGNSYIINGFAYNSLNSIDMIVFTSLSNKDDVFILPKSEFLAAIDSTICSTSLQSFKFHNASQNIASSIDTFFLEDKQIFKKRGFFSFPRPHKGVIFLLILLVLLSFSAIFYINYIKIFH